MGETTTPPESVPRHSGTRRPPASRDHHEALAALLADVVELTRSSAMYPGHFALIAEQARGFESVRRALRVSGE